MIWTLRARLVFAFLMLPAWAAAVEDYTFLPALPVVNSSGMPLLDIGQCGERLLAVGERGLAIYSSDKGEHWTQAQMPVSQTLTAVYCLSSGRAWAVGHSGVILGSVDGGINWSLQFDGIRSNQQWLAHTRRQKAELEAAVAVAGPDEIGDLEYALEEAIFAVEDAQLAAEETGPADPFLDVWFRNEQEGIAVGAYGMLYLSRDGGESWQLTAAGIDNPDRYHYYSIAESAGGVLFLSGEAGLLYRSRDGGQTWARLDAGYDGSLFGLVTTADGAVLVFGLRGNILRSTDDGVTWQSVVVENGARLSLYGGARLRDGSVALVGAGGAVLTSADHGRSFRGSTMAGRNTLSAVAGEDVAHILAVGMAGLEVPSGTAP